MTDFLKKITGFEFFMKSKRFFITAFSILFISILSIIIFFKTGNIQIAQTAFQFVSYIAMTYLGLQTASDKLSDWIKGKNDNNNNNLKK